MLRGVCFGVCFGPRFAAMLRNTSGPEAETKPAQQGLLTMCVISIKPSLAGSSRNENAARWQNSFKSRTGFAFPREFQVCLGYASGMLRGASGMIRDVTPPPPRKQQMQHHQQHQQDQHQQHQHQQQYQHQQHQHQQHQQR